MSFRINERKKGIQKPEVRSQKTDKEPPRWMMRSGVAVSTGPVGASEAPGCFGKNHGLEERTHDVL